MRRPSPRTTLAIVGLALLAVSACSSEDPSSAEPVAAEEGTSDAAPDGGDAGSADGATTGESDAPADGGATAQPQADDTDGDTPSDVTDTDDAADGDVVREGHVIHEFTEAPVVVEDGIRLGAVLMAAASLDAPDVAIPLEAPDPDAETVFGLQVVVINERDEPVTVRLNEADLEVAGTRVPADTLASDPFDGELAAGGEATTQVLWQLSTPFDEVMGGAGVGYVAEVESATGTARITLPVTWD